MTTTEIYAQVRKLILDLDSTDQSVTDALILARFNEKYLRWFEGPLGQRTSRTNSTTLIGATGIASGGTGAVTALQDIISFESVFRETTATNTSGPLMERIEVNDMYRLQNEESTVGTPTKYALLRTASATSASQGKWTILVHPLSDGNSAANWHLSAILKRYPTALDGATYTTPDVSDAAAYTLCRLTAAELAGELGRDDAFISRILAPVSDEAMQSMGVTRRSYMLPRARPDEGAV